MRTRLEKALYPANREDDFFKRLTEDERNTLLRDHIKQTSEMGIYGVTLKESGLPVIKVLEEHLSKDSRDEVRQINFDYNVARDYFQTTAERFEITPEAVQAAAIYYRKYQSEFEAYFMYQKALNKKDPILNPSITPQEIFPQK